MLKSLHRGLWALVLCAGLGQMPVHAQTYNASFEDQVIALVNGIRSDAGLGLLLEDARLTAAARAHSLDMATNGCFSHDSCDGTTWDDRLFTYYPLAGIGENIAAGYATPASVVDAWMNSTGHRANILNASWQGIGVGYVSATGSAYGSYWTQDFGTLAPVPEPETWALLLAGLGLMGAITRRRGQGA